MSVDFLLHESAVGYAIFSVRLKSDSIGARLKEVQGAHEDLARFGKMVRLVSFAPFQGAAHALENANDLSEGIMSEYLRTTLEANLPKSGKMEKNKTVLGVAEKGLAGSIKAVFPGLQCETSETSELCADLLRGIRLHDEKLLKGLQPGDVSRAQLGLGHAYSRAKVKFSVQKDDNHIIHAIAILDNADKTINTFAMRVREWYSWHFPELVKIVSDNHRYARCVLFIGDKKSLSDESLYDLAKMVDDDQSVAKAIIAAARVSMGQDIGKDDMNQIMAFATRVVSQVDHRNHIAGYLRSKMDGVAPNLAALLGDMVSARLISHAGSLTNLAKYPASTVQILGAEKALFRALKTKGNTPKYGLLYHSSFIGKAGMKNKGRIARFLANKTSIAARTDNFASTPTRVYGEALKSQVEERLRFYSEGINPSKNADVMTAAMNKVLANLPDSTTAAAEEAIPAPGVTKSAAEKVLRKELKKQAKKASRHEDVEMEDTEPGNTQKRTAGNADVEESVKAKLKAEKKAKRKAEKLAAGEVPDDQIGKKAKKAKLSKT